MARTHTEQARQQTAGFKQISLTTTAATGKVWFGLAAEWGNRRFPTQELWLSVLPFYRDIDSVINGFRAAEDKQGCT